MSPRSHWPWVPRPWSGRASAAATIAARLKFDAVECRFDGHPAVAGITLEVAPGESYPQDYVDMHSDERRARFRAALRNA